MRKFLLLFLAFLTIGAANAQSVSITSNPSNSVNIVTGSSGLYHVGEHIYLESEIGAGNFTSAATAINQVAFKVYAVGTPTTFNNFKIYFKEVPAATTTLTSGTYSTAGYTEVFSGSFTAPTTGWVVFNLTAPFTRTAGMNLQVMTERTDGVTHTGYSWDASTGNTTAGNAAQTSRRYNGNTALSGTTSLSASNFRAAIQFKHAVNNDASAIQVYALGKIPVQQSQTIQAYIYNNGLNALTNIPVTLNVTGANTYSNTQNVASLAVGAGTFVTFPAFTANNAGTNNISVTLNADGDNSNNSKATSQLVALTQIGYPDGGAPTTSIGYNTGAGLLVNRHQVNVPVTITEVRVSLNSSAVGNQVFGVVLDAAGNILAQSANYTVTAGDANTYKSFTFATPPTIPAGTNFHIGLGQVANATTGYFPLNVQGEDPGRTGAYFGAALAGGTLTEYSTLGRFMIEASFGSSLPVNLTAFNGERKGKINQLTWTTASESNNRGFNIQRSADGKNFSMVGFAASKGENGYSNLTLNYNFNDENPLSGTNYYRLAQVDKDGKTMYSGIVTIKGDKSFGISALYPNPVRDQLNIAITSTVSEKASLVITDVTGKVVMQMNTALVSGDNNINLNVSSLSNGVYYLKLMNGSSPANVMQFVKN